MSFTRKQERSIIEKILNMQGFDAEDCVSVGDSEMDLINAS